jgi:hypothetical protein
MAYNKVENRAYLGHRALYRDRVARFYMAPAPGISNLPPFSGMQFSGEVNIRDPESFVEPWVMRTRIL